MEDRFCHICNGTLSIKYDENVNDLYAHPVEVRTYTCNSCHYEFVAVFPKIQIT